MLPVLPTIATILEVRRLPSGELPAPLISSAYLASRSAAVLLVLDSVTRDEVDRVLDPVVSRFGRDRRGVVYAERGDDREVLALAANGCAVFASSDAFRARLSSLGIAFRDATDAEFALARAE